MGRRSGKGQRSAALRADRRRSGPPPSKRKRQSVPAQALHRAFCGGFTLPISVNHRDCQRRSSSAMKLACQPQRNIPISKPTRSIVFFNLVCALANRPSAGPAIKVLLLEAGGRDINPLIHMPAGFFPMLQAGMVSWKYQTAPQRHLDNRVLNDARGKVLGGSSSINAMCYSRGRPEIFNLWGELGNHGWSYSDVMPYFKRAECSWRGEDEFHGGSGPLRVSHAKVTNPGHKAWLEAAQQAGFPYSDDHNGAKPEGFGPAEYTISKGRRMSTAVTYLRPAERRPNLKLLTKAYVTRIIARRRGGISPERSGHTGSRRSRGHQQRRHLPVGATAHAVGHR